MRNQFASVMLVLCSLMLCSAGVSAGDKLLVSGCGWKQVSVIDKETQQVEWQYALNKGEDCNDVEVTRQGNVLYAYTGGARMISFAQEVIWDFKAASGEELFTATQLRNGNYLLAMCGNPSRIVELDGEGKQIDELRFDVNILGVHDQFRQLLPTRNNTYLIPLMGKGKVIEMNKAGKIIRTVEVGGNPFSMKVLKSGHWLVSCGDAHCIVEADPRKNRIVKTIHSDSIADVSLLFVAELIRDNDGNTLISNWSGHSQDKTQPRLLEIDKNNNIVWTLKTTPEIGDISTVFVFDKKVKTYPFFIDK